MKNLIFIKFGGSLITNKQKQDKLDLSILKNLASQIAKIVDKQKETVFILGNGAGSFGHAQADKYQAHKGLINKNSLKGLAEVAYSAQKLNQLIVKELIACGLAAVAISPLSIISSDNSKVKKIFADSTENLLRIGALPVVYGDVILDEKMGFTIFSTEKIFSALARKLRKKYKIEKIILIGRTNGVLDKNGKTIAKITPANIKKYKPAIGKAKGYDVTGGMEHKVNEALALAKKGVNSIIINGQKEDILVKIFSEEYFDSTFISKT